MQNLETAVRLLFVVVPPAGLVIVDPVESATFDYGQRTSYRERLLLVRRSDFPRALGAPHYNLLYEASVVVLGIGPVWLGLSAVGSS